MIICLIRLRNFFEKKIRYCFFQAFYYYMEIFISPDRVLPAFNCVTCKINYE